MSKKNTKTKLPVNRETLMHLQSTALEDVNGGTGPTVTTVTITTTVASHPIITCHGG